MQLSPLVEQLDTFFTYKRYPDFIVDILQAVDANAAQRFVPQYLHKTSGLMLDFSTDIATLYCAAFPSDDLLEHLAAEEARDALLIVKHPLDWQELGVGFTPISDRLIAALRERRISLYCAHAAHDNHPACAPSLELARALPFSISASMADAHGRAFGYVVESDQPLCFAEFRTLVAATFQLGGMQTRHAHDSIRRIAVIAGGGDNIAWLQQAHIQGCDTYLTGILHFQGSEYAQQHNPAFIAQLQASPLNAVGISHYLSEIRGSIKLAQLLNAITNLPTAFLEERCKAQHIYTHWEHTL